MIRLLLIVAPALLAFFVGYHSGSANVKLKAEHNERLLEERISRLETTHATEQARLSDTIKDLEERLNSEASDDPNADNIAIDADGVRRIDQVGAED